MTVYVDEVMRWPTATRTFRDGSCHLTADTVEELHAFARKLRLRREWFQDCNSPHYDLTPGKRVSATRLGAVFVPAKEQARRRLAMKRATQGGDHAGASGESSSPSPEERPEGGSPDRRPGR
ncbi:MAG: DUF4031 domain-containing protein [Deltaproteobacteria bacterium]|nr:DUF4031 domain-containing protein [Deltaproteobacteria bacterium]